MREIRGRSAQEVRIVMLFECERDVKHKEIFKFVGFAKRTRTSNLMFVGFGNKP